MTPTIFRQTFPAFADPGKFPDLQLNYWITVANNFLNGSADSCNGDRWGVNLDYGIGLFMAHHLSLDARDAVTVAAGGIPGELVGPASAKAVDKVSKSMDTHAVTFEDEPFWNLTRYGIQFLTIARMVGAGGVQLGTMSGIPTVGGYNYTNWGVFYNG